MAARVGHLRRVAEALVMLTVADALVRSVSFRRISRTLGTPQQATADRVETADQVRALAVGRAVRSAAVRLPHHPVCLAQAIAAQWMLRLRRVPATVYLGARIGEPDSDPATLRANAEMTAHAWVRVGRAIVVGQAEHDTFTPVASFARRPSPDPHAPAEDGARQPTSSVSTPSSP